MRKAEQELLHKLSTAEGELLDNPELVASLNCMKQETSRMEEALQQAIEAQQKISQQRDRYRAATGRGALLFMQVQALERLNPMYAFSIDMYIQVFKDTLLTSVERQEDDCDAFEAHRKGMAGDVIALLASEFSAVATQAVFLHIVAGLKREDKLVFSVALCLSILGHERPNEFPPELLAFLLKGPPGSTNTPNCIPWLPDDKWDACLSLEQRSPVFKGFTGDLLAHTRWNQWYGLATPELEGLPGEWQSVTSFHKLLVLRCLRPDRMPIALENFMRTELGPIYVDPPQQGIGEVLSRPKSHTVILWSGLGNDPLSAVKAYHSAKIGSSLVSIDVHDELNDNVDSISRVALKGGWCVLDSVHLAPELLPLLSPVLGNSEISPRFLMVLTADPACASELPVNIVRGSMKLTTDTSCSLKPILQTTWDVASQYCTSITRQGELRRLLFLLTYFHAVCLRRNIFLRRGFVNAPYAFGSSDLSTSRHVIQMLLQQTASNTQIHWSDLREMVVTEIYGALCTSDTDLEIIKSIGESIFSEHNMTHSDFCRLPLEMNADAQEIQQTISGAEWSAEDDVKYSMLDATSITEMHQIRSVQLCEGLRKLEHDIGRQQPDTPDNDHERHARRAKQSDIIKQLPTTPIDVSNINTSNIIISTWVQEASYCNAVVEMVRNDLTDRDDVLPELLTDDVPQKWISRGFETSHGLASWIQSLLQRDLLLRNWSANPQVPRVVMIHLVFRPKSFLVNMLIAGMKPPLTLDACHFDVEILKKSADKVGAPARNGVHIWGMRLLLCKWSSVAQAIDQSSGTVVDGNSCLPVITLRVCEKSGDDDHSPELWSCPVYSTASRRTLVMKLPIPSKKATSFWTLVGACAVLESAA
eukprot:TRINITY_DN2171_c0_g1_i3.p1 TRINITY_DN2171_c0_g1~~TRINITY_DN2171_c0_g1_i3.p1  ORF type:complete len:942 (+),score=177.74 TRINITY_DN2171_c0_g1_i3:209-2827(+)